MSDGQDQLEVTTPAPAPAAVQAPPEVVARRRRARLMALPVVVVLGVLVVYAIVAIAAGGRVPGGTTVAGLPIGGMSRESAVAKLRAASDPLQGKGLRVRVGSEETTLDLVDAGLAFDPGEVVDGLTGFTLAPATVWHRLTGGGAVEVGADDGRLVDALTALGRRTDTPPTQATVTFQGTRPVVGDPVPGTSLDVAAAAAKVRGSWLSAAQPVVLPVRTVAPTIGADEAQAAVKSLAEPALAAPLTITLGGRSAVLPPAAVAPALSLVADDKGEGLRLRVDGERLHDALLKAAPGIETPAKDASLKLQDGKPVVVDGTPGEGVDPAQLADVAVRALAGDHKVALTPAPIQPRLTTEKLKALGVKEEVSTFSTKLTDNALRTENLRVAARAVNGTLVLPGQTFSLNATLGERTPEKGYNQAPAINGGRLVRDYGGGVSQMATTIFNNVFFAGLEDVYHKPHSFYISRYPEGREATVNWPTVDLKWRNDSPYAVWIQAWVDSKVHVSFWSTKVWDVEALKSPRSTITQPETIYDPRPGCVTQEPSPGFDVTVTRIFKKNGAEVKRQTFRTTYIPEDEVICRARPGSSGSGSSGSGSSGTSSPTPTPTPED
ncbi:MAG: VanW family protein [Kineosporiaceae bacterium]